MSEIPESEILRNKLVTYSESELRFLLINFFNKIGYADLSHGTTEHGADIELILAEKNDPIGIGQVCFLQVKSGEVSNSIWRNTLCSQMVECLVRPIVHPNTSQFLSRRIILVTNGKVVQSVMNSIKNWNERIQIPIEVLDGRRLANLLASYNYNTSMMDEQIRGETPVTVGSKRNVSSRRMVGHSQ